MGIAGTLAVAFTTGASAQSPDAIARCQAQPAQFQHLCFEAITPRSQHAGAPTQLAPPTPPQPSQAPNASVSAHLTQDAPLTDCDALAANDFDPQHNAKGVPIEKINPALAIPACESAVRQYPNSGRLMAQLARAYYKNKDFKSAFVQIQKAAEQGYAIAQNNLGALYENGQGVAKDAGQAIAWYRKAADQGLALLAQNNLAAFEASSSGVSASPAQSPPSAASGPLCGKQRQRAGSALQKAARRISGTYSHALFRDWMQGLPG